MKLESFKDKKVTRRKMILISLGVITIVGVSLLLYKTFASFSEEVSFPMMSGKVNYYGNADIIFAFYKGDQLLDEMPQKDNKDNLVFDYGTCDNDATIEWNKEKWAPLVKGLNKTKTKCNLYFKEGPTLESVSPGYNGGMWNYKFNLTKVVIETKKSKKEASEGQVVHGPFDESSTKDRAIESYVVCDTGDTNCIGYLQGDGKIKLNRNSSYLFDRFYYVTEIDGIENLDASGVTDMSGMFSEMNQLQELDLSTFDTSSVTDMSRMFSVSGTSQLKSLNLGSNFNTSSVTDMHYMFYDMDNLQSLTFGENFNNNNVIDMSSMFYGLSKLQELDLSKFGTSKVTNMSDMFRGMSSIQKLDLSHFDTSKVEDMGWMFLGMSNLQTLILGEKFNTKSVKNMKSMFYGMISIQELDLSHFDTSNVTDMGGMFAGMYQLQELDLSSFDTSKVEDMGVMFMEATKLTKITYGPNFIHKAGADVSLMFYSCKANKPDASVHSSWSGVSFD